MSVESVVRTERRATRVAALAIGALHALALLLGGLAIAALAFGAGRWIGAPRWLPLLVALALAAGTVAIVRRALRLARAAAARDAVASRLEEERGLRRGALVAGLQLGTAGGAFAAAGIAALEAPLARRDAGQPSRRPVRRLLAAAGVVALGAAALAAAAPGRGDGVRAALHPIAAWRGDLLPRLAIADVPPEVRRGSNFSVTVSAAGRRQVLLRERQIGSVWRERRIELDSSGSARVIVGPVQGDVTLAVADARGSSPEMHVRAVERAYLAATAVLVTAPAYLGGGSERVEPGAPLRVPRGSTIAIETRGTVPLGSVSLASGRDTIQWRVAAQRASGGLHAERDGRWEWRARSTSGEALDVPSALDVAVIPDSAPTITIAQPAADTVVATGASVTVRLLASDDHGIATVRLLVHANGAAPVVRDVAGGLPARWGADVAVDPQALGVSPGHAVQLVAEAIDDSPWRQVGRSRALVLRVPGLAEQRELARAAADSLVRAATSAAAGEHDLQRRTADAARDRGTRAASGKSGSSTEATSAGQQRQDAMPYETEQRARGVRDEQQKLSQNVDAMRQRASDLQQQLARAGALDTALARQLADAQRMLKEALTPELAASLAALDSALKQRSGDAARASLSDLAREQQKLKDQLDRIAEMLSRAAVEGSLQTLNDEARDVAQAQRALADSGSRAAQDARQLEQRARTVSRDAAALAQRLQKAGGDQSSRDASQASADAKGSADEMQQSGARQARDAASQMDNAAESLARARREQIGAWKSELANELDRSIQEMLQMAQDERSLEQRSREGSSPEALRGEQSAVQQGVDKTSERLEKASRASSLVSGGARRAVAEARKQTSDATEATAKPNGSPRPATDQFAQAADALTRAAAALVRDRERVNSSASATGFAEMMREMQELAKQQGALNGQAAGLFQMPNGQQGAGQQGRTLAREQRAVAQKLDQLGDADGSGRAEALAAEARRVAEALERGDLSEATKARQERLLQRMLDAGRSLEGEERDEGKREATSATGVQLFTPPAGDAKGAAAQRWREPTWDELRGLTAEERRAVIDYFRRMNATTTP